MLTDEKSMNSTLTRSLKLLGPCSVVELHHFTHLRVRQTHVTRHQTTRRLRGGQLILVNDDFVTFFCDNGTPPNASHASIELAECLELFDVTFKRLRKVIKNHLLRINGHAKQAVQKQRNLRRRFISFRNGSPAAVIDLCKSEVYELAPNKFFHLLKRAIVKFDAVQRISVAADIRNHTSQSTVSIHVINVKLFQILTRT
mmetsp:Transcript_4492/g.14853  ORF Transcript_4492/g.14853 Transcript_4492/m.14853 type:complete len:200 (+) Transcript_4492:2170-2769(+)